MTYEIQSEPATPSSRAVTRPDLAGMTNEDLFRAWSKAAGEDLALADVYLKEASRRMFGASTPSRSKFKDDTTEQLEARVRELEDEIEDVDYRIEELNEEKEPIEEELQEIEEELENREDA